MKIMIEYRIDTKTFIAKGVEVDYDGEVLSASINIEDERWSILEIYNLLLDELSEIALDKHSPLM